MDPPIDRSKPPSQQQDPDAYLAVVQETSAGLIMRGAKAVATASPYADEILILPAVESRPGFTTAADQKYAVIFAIPTHTPGLRFLCREPFGGGNRFDHPLASHLDKTDGVAIFDDVLVPLGPGIHQPGLPGGAPPHCLRSGPPSGRPLRVATYGPDHAPGGRASGGEVFSLPSGWPGAGMQMMQRESPFGRDMLAEITIYIEAH